MLEPATCTALESFVDIVAGATTGGHASRSSRSGTVRKRPGSATRETSHSSGTWWRSCHGRASRRSGCGLVSSPDVEAGSPSRADRSSVRSWRRAICGVVALGRRRNDRRPMTRALAHRGPDGGDSIPPKASRSATGACDHRPLRRGTAAVRERGRPASAHPQREVYNTASCAATRGEASAARPRRSSSPRTRNGATAASSASTGCGRSRSGTAGRSRSSAPATASASIRSTTGSTGGGSASRAG